MWTIPSAIAASGALGSAAVFGWAFGSRCSAADSVAPPPAPARLVFFAAGFEVWPPFSAVVGCCAGVAGFVVGCCAARCCARIDPPNASEPARGPAVTHCFILAPQRDLIWAHPAPLYSILSATRA